MHVFISLEVHRTSLSCKRIKRIIRLKKRMEVRRGYYRYVRFSTLTNDILRVAHEGTWVVKGIVLGYLVMGIILGTTCIIYLFNLLANRHIGLTTIQCPHRKVWETSILASSTSTDHRIRHRIAETWIRIISTGPNIMVSLRQCVYRESCVIR